MVLHMITKYSYFEIFYNPDIPLLERVGWAALSPLVIPAAAAVAVLSMGGCSTSHEPLPLPNGNDKPLPFPEKVDAISSSSDVPQEPQDSYTCVPDPCGVDKLDFTRRQGDMAMCISFNKKMILDSGPHLALSLADVDGDGDTDIYVFNTGTPHQLFLNQGNGDTFTESAKQFSLNLQGNHYAALWGDFNSDKTPDMLLLGDDGASLFLNTNGTFSKSVTLTTSPSHTAYWFKEGYFLGTENGLRFYAPKAGGTYEDIAKKMGLVDAGDARRFAVVDFDGDKDSDIYVANETGANRMFRNEGDGTFESVEIKLHLDKPYTNGAPNPYGQSPSRDVSWVKLSPKKDPMFYVSNYDVASWMFDRQSDGTYSNVAKQYGIQDGGKTVRAAWADFLNEGAPSLFIARTYEYDTDPDKNNQLSLLYIPESDTQGNVTGYRDIAYPNGMSGPAHMVGADWADMNGDGKLDLVTAAYDGAVTVYINDSKWVKVCP